MSTSPSEISGTSKQEKAPAATAADSAAAEISAATESASSATIELDGGDVLNLDFVAVELFEVRGRVLHKGLPLAEVEIDAGSLGGAVTSAEGRFVFGDIPEGESYMVTALKSGFIFKSDDNSGIVGGPTEVSFTATELFSIRGTISHNGTPLEGVQVDAGDLGARLTDAAGGFVFDEIPEHTEYSIAVSKDKFMFSPAEHTATVENGPAVLEFKATELFTISGRVLHKGVAMEGVEIDGGPLGITVTDAEGRYEFRNVPDGAEYSIVARKGNFVFGKMTGKQGGRPA